MVNPTRRVRGNAARSSPYYSRPLPVRTAADPSAISSLDSYRQTDQRGYHCWRRLADSICCRYGRADHGGPLRRPRASTCQIAYWAKPAAVRRDSFQVLTDNVKAAANKVDNSAAEVEVALKGLMAA